MLPVRSLQVAVSGFSHERASVCLCGEVKKINSHPGWLYMDV